MQLTARECCGAGAGEPIARACAAAGIARDRFDAWWREETAAVAGSAGSRRAAVRASVRIDRAAGVSHTFPPATTPTYSSLRLRPGAGPPLPARLPRRRGAGRLAEILARTARSSTCCCARSASRTSSSSTCCGAAPSACAALPSEWAKLDAEVQALVTAFTAGVNAVIEEGPPAAIEFDLLDYEPSHGRRSTA